MKGILRNATFLVGLALTVGAFLAFLILGNVFNPPPYQVVVIVRDVTPGTPLTKDLLTTSAQGISSRVASGYVLAGELSQYLGATIIEPMHPGDPLTKSRLVKDGNPAAIQRAALGLDNPAKTLMVVPVDDKTAPDNIVHGDHLDLVYTVGREPTSTETQLPSGYTAPGSTSETPEEEEESLALPLAKLVFKNLRVARIHREKQANPSYSGAEGESPYIDGKLNGLEVVIDREQEELLSWAVQHGKVRVALLSPNAPPDTSIATMGMTWDDLVEWFKAARQGGLAVLSGEPAPALPPASGAAAVVRATRQAEALSVYAGIAQPTQAAGAGSGGAAVTPLPSPGAAVSATVVAAATVPVPTTQPPAPSPTAVAIASPTPAPGSVPPTGDSPSLLASGVSCLLCGSVVIGALVLLFSMLRNRNKGKVTRP